MNDKAKHFFAVLLLVLFLPVVAVAETVTVDSENNFAVTVERCKTFLSEKKIDLMAEIDHGAGAEKAGMELGSTLLLLFGKAEAGTPLMQSSRTIGLDLPMKMLIWEDDKNQVRISYTTPMSILAQYEVKEHQKLGKKLQGLLGKMAAFAGKKE